MKNIILTSILLGMLISCGSPKENSNDSQETKKEQKAKNGKLDVETYCKMSNEFRALLMEKYWEQFKGKSYEEVKDIYEKYQKEEDAIFDKYGLENKLDFSNFFRGHFKEIEAFQKTNPEYKEYEEYPDAKRKIVDFAMKSI